MKRCKFVCLLSALLALLMLVSCGAGAQAPVSTPEVLEPDPEESSQITVETPEDQTAAGPSVVKVGTVDEFLAAIAPNTVIELAAGEYDLSTAVNYGLPTDGRYYRWNPDPSYEGEGYELEIFGAEGLVIRGAGQGETTISAVPRFVNVLRFTNCKGLSVQSLTAGHTREAGLCSGGVLDFEKCSGVTVDDCGLYGCGVVGVWAFNSEDLSVANTHIYECSSSAVEVSSCRNVRVENCEIDRMGANQDWPIYAIFAVHESDGFLVSGCRIYDNQAMQILLSDRTKNCFFLSNLLESNSVSYAFWAQRFCPVVAGCLFADQGMIGSWYGGDGVLAVDRDGNGLDDAAFASMRFEEIDPASVHLPEDLTHEAEPTAVPAGGSITVTTVDELLAAIGPDRTIVLDGAEFALSGARNYGGIGTKYCYWSEVYDGQELVIDGVKGLTIVGGSADAAGTLVTAEPRYANVLRFVGCSDLNLQGFTAGHTKGHGECSGGVLHFEDCSDVRVDGCRLYGCGILGVWSIRGQDLAVENTEIYECSIGAVIVDSTAGVSFTDCNIHNVPSPALAFYGCRGVLWNGDSYYDGNWDLDSSGKLSPYDYADLTPDNSQLADPVPESVSVMYQSRAIDELILKVGDSVILTAEGTFPNGDGNRAKYTWTAEDSSVLSARVSRDSRQCVVKVLAGAPDGVLLTVDCGGVQHQVRIFAVGGAAPVPSPSAVPTAQPMPEVLDTEKQYQANVFLSNFSEQNFQPFDADAASWDQMLRFVHIYCKINRQDLISYDNGDEVISLEDANRLFLRFFGKSSSPAEGETYAPSGRYSDGSYRWPAADGESYTAFTVVTKLEPDADGCYLATFQIYEVDLDEYWSLGGVDRSYYYMNIAGASDMVKAGRITAVNSGQAVLRPYNNNGVASYQLVRYVLWGEPFVN